MIDRLKMVFAALLVAAGIVLAGPTAAQAAALHGCPDDYVCLYQGVNYWAPAGDANPGWKSSLSNLYNSPNGCINLTSPAAYWPNNTQVWDNSGAAVVNVGAWQGTWYVTFFDWINCNTSGGLTSSAQFSLGDTSWPDLRDVPIGADLYAYHRFTSVQISYGSCPPGGC